MPLQRRLPKRGFTSRISKNSAELRLHELAIPSEDIIDIDVLKKLNLVPKNTNKVKVILSGELKKSVTIKGLNVTKGALSAIEAAGGKVEI
jgi:large subunit ribosomal protein L15